MPPDHGTKQTYGNSDRRISSIHVKPIWKWITRLSWCKSFYSLTCTTNIGALLGQNEVCRSKPPCDITNWGTIGSAAFRAVITGKKLNINKSAIVAQCRRLRWLQCRVRKLMSFYRKCNRLPPVTHGTRMRNLW